MVGSLGEWGPKQLPSGEDDFGRGSKATFAFDAEDLGQLREVRLP